MTYSLRSHSGLKSGSFSSEISTYRAYADTQKPINAYALMILLTVPSWTMIRQARRPLVPSYIRRQHTVALALAFSHLYYYLLLSSVIREIGFMQMPIYGALLTLYCIHYFILYVYYVSYVVSYYVFESSKDEDKLLFHFPSF